MELSKVKVQNYRSVDDVTVDVIERCLIFLGINESGKSNVLKGISALSQDFVFNFQEDSKIPVNDDNYNFKEPVISYTFKLTDGEKKSLFENIWGQDSKNWPILFPTKTPIQFIKDFPQEIIYKLTFKNDNSRNESFEYGFNNSNFSIKENIFLATQAFEVPIEGKDALKFSLGEIISTTNLTEVVAQEIFKQNAQAFSFQDIFNALTPAINDHIKTNLPSVIYWKYDQKYLLTDSVPIEEFKKNTDMCLPLRNIFRLAGITEIENSIDSHYNNDSAFHNLKEKLSTAATNHLKKVWKEYDGVKIMVNERNGKFSVQVKDSKNLYNFGQRSDGFKRFISFLLILSAEHKADKLPKNSILIFDEPDISLHPSGTRHLLKEIIELGKKNYAFVASHSVFFIDRDKITRHIIVTKENESTIIKPANYQNFTDEEVLYQALGCSLFDVLKKRNLCFEGWTDKEVYKILSDLFAEDIENLKDFVKNHGILWSSSASKICQTIKPFIGGSERVFFAIADFDGAGKKEKENFEEEFSDTENDFYTYKDLSSRELTQMTLEDLLPIDLMIVFFNEYIKEISGNEPSLPLTKEKIDKNGIISSWETFCSREYKPLKDKLTSGYKNRIPEFIRKYIQANSNDLVKVKDEFSFYKTYLKNKVEKIKHE